MRARIWCPSFISEKHCYMVKMYRSNILIASRFTKFVKMLSYKISLKITLTFITLTSMFPNPEALNKGCFAITKSSIPMITFTSRNSPRIVGGDDVTPHELPYQLLVMVRQVGTDGGTFCGGVALKSNFILTAAHCTVGADPNHILVIGGVHELMNKFETTRQATEGVRNIIHPNYFADPSKGIIRNDISIVKVSPSLRFNSYIQPIKLSTSRTSSGAKSGIISGWGCTNQNMDKCKGTENGLHLPTVLQKLNVSIWTDVRCKDKLRGVQILDSHICVGGLESEGACLGDSGGPLVGVENGHKFLVGITSFGLDVGCGCNGIPTVYSKVSHYSSWIIDAVKKPYPADSSSPSMNRTSKSSLWFLRMTLNLLYMYFFLWLEV